MLSRFRYVSSKLPSKPGNLTLLANMKLHTSATDLQHVQLNTIEALDLIKGYDNNFSTAIFQEKAELAIEWVSKRVAEGKFEELEKLVNSNELQRVKEVTKTFDEKTQGWIAVNAGDISNTNVDPLWYHFPERDFITIGIVCTGLHSRFSSFDPLSKKFKCLYTFSKDLSTEVNDSTYIIERMHHFKLHKKIL